MIDNTDDIFSVFWPVAALSTIAVLDLNKNE